MAIRPIGFLLGVTMATLLSSCTDNTESIIEESPFPRIQQLDRAAPVAAKQPFVSTHHGIDLTDDFYWLKDQDYPTVNDQPIIDYLNAENQYFAQFLKPHRKLVDTLYEEFKGRVNDEDSAVPWTYQGYEYHWFYRQGEDYRTWVRRKLDSQTEEVFLDENELAAKYEYFKLSDWDISPDNKYLAYSVDTDGSERNVIKIVDRASGELLEDTLVDAEGEFVFGKDSKTIIYTKLDKTRWHATSINLHVLGQQQSQDKFLLEEHDDSFSLGFSMTSSEQFLIAQAQNSEQAETHVFDFNDLSKKPVKLNDRKQKFLLQVDHGNGYFYLLANDKHVNNRLAKVADNAPQYDNWQTVIAGSDSRYILDLQVFQDFLALEEKNQGLELINILPYEGKAYSIALPEKVASVSLGNNSEFEQQHLRLNYESMISPDSVLDYDLTTQALIERKVKALPSGYDKSQYKTERVMAVARDGANVPVTLVYNKGFKKDGSQPLYLYGYGAYGSGLSPSFSTIRLSLLDRGFAFAYAHVRGGDEMGYQWYLDGKQDKRTNTFNDFVDVARYLVKENYVAAGNISIGGRSAGGELMGAAVIQAPELWRSVNLGVPFVDVLNTMLDESLPLTPLEWSEWGNPIASREVFELLQSYSPYDNIEAREYPPMLVTGGLNDPRVTYWEPAKWTAKMRNKKTDNNLLVMRINMGAGHFANSGRYGRLKDYAEEYAFTLLSHGITN